MSIQSQIKQLFESLGHEERDIILQELQLTNRAIDGGFKAVPVKVCPYCSSSLLIKNGHRGATQRYKCKACHKTFTGTSGACFHGIKKMDKFEEYRKLMFEQYLPIKVIAKKTGVSVQTAFDWRHKILGGLNAKAEQFQGITEIDDIWFLYSQKGRKGLKYSRKRGGSKRQGDNNYQVKLLVTADRESNQDFSVARIGRIKKSDLERKVGGKFNESCILVSDKHRSISAFAKSEKISHVSFKSSEHSAGGEFHVQTVNNLATRMKGIVNHPFYTYTEGVDVWTNPEDGTKYESNFVPVWRWRRAQFNNFRCRMDWCTEPYENANHHPKAVLNGDHSNKIFFINAKAGDRITLDASGSNDPDGDQIEISWWNYREAGTYEGMPKIGNPSGVTTAVEIPRDAAGKEIHLILEVKDLNKIASLWDYRRMVITVQNQN